MNTDNPTLEIHASRQFTSWLYEQNLSLAFTTYQAGKLFAIGLQPSGQISVFERTFERCMGLYVSGSRLYMSSLYQLWRFENALEPGKTHNGYDCVYVPQVGYTTGDLDIHDIGAGTERINSLNGSSLPQKLIFVNTLFSSLATVSEQYSFIPVWKPPFISRLAAEDRCHLNGLTIVNGEPKYVTAVSQSDVADGWRDRRVDEGYLIDVKYNKVSVT